MDRRSFFRTMIGGVATAAAVRTWPFRSYFFPSNLRRLPMDLGFNVFDYAGLPIIEDPFIQDGKIWMLNHKLIVANPSNWARLKQFGTPTGISLAE